MKKIYYRYGLYGAIRLFYGVIISRLFLSQKIRIIRTPFYIRGARHISWGTGLTSGINLRIDADPEDCSRSSHDKVLKFGNNVQVNDYVHIGAIKSVIIGDNVLIASKVFISDHNHGVYNGNSQSSPDTNPALRPVDAKPVFIGDNVWIGEQVSVLPGVKIGSGCIIGANSVVTKSIPPNCIATGVPAVVIKRFNFLNNKWEKI